MPPLGSLGARVVWRTARVVSTVQETPHARTLVLDVPEWPGHRAGQHVDVRLTAPDGYQAERSYSIASAPELDHVELTVELVEDGEVSPYFVEVVEPGDELEVRGPIGGHFTWSAAEGGPLFLVGGGSGLVPLMSMLRHRAARGSTVPTTLLVSTRAPTDLLYADELVEAPGLSIARTYTRAAPPGWEGYARRVDRDMLREVAPPADSGARVFVCGPTPFVELVTGLLVELGFPPRDIHAERFGPTGGSS